MEKEENDQNTNKMEIEENHQNKMEQEESQQNNNQIEKEESHQNTYQIIQENHQNENKISQQQNYQIVNQINQENNQQNSIQIIQENNYQIINQVNHGENNSNEINHEESNINKENQDGNNSSQTNQEKNNINQDIHDGNNSNEIIEEKNNTNDIIEEKKSNELLEEKNSSNEVVQDENNPNQIIEGENNSNQANQENNNSNEIIEEKNSEQIMEEENKTEKNDILEEETEQKNDSVMNEYEFFRLLFSNEILDLLVEESNNFMKKLIIEEYGPDYREIVLSRKTNSTYAYLYVTKGIKREDILAFIGMRIYMGLHKYTKIDLYWSDSIIYKNYLKDLMPKHYFYLLSKALHFPEKEEKDDESTNNSTKDDDKSEISFKVDPRQKIQLYLEKLAQNFQKYYALGANITIDESLLQFKGRNSMKFYIPMKPHKWGFKIHLLCDSDTHYLYNMLFDPGKIGKEFLQYDENYTLSENIVLKLLSCLKDNKERNLFCDGWYSSIGLMKKLSKMGYLVTTVLRNNSKELPSKIKLSGYDKAYCDGIFVQKYEGKKTILFATNYEVDKEELRNIYNIKNRGVDTFDQYLEMSSIQRRTKRWYKKILLFGIDASIINSKILCELRTGKSYTTVKFKEKIVEHIFKMYSGFRKKNEKHDKNSSVVTNPIPAPSQAHNIGHINEKKRCMKCRKKTPYICIKCNVHLHPECYTSYHNKLSENSLK